MLFRDPEAQSDMKRVARGVPLGRRGYRQERRTKSAVVVLDDWCTMRPL
jgi:hypothetical protein